MVMMFGKSASDENSGSVPNGVTFTCSQVKVEGWTEDVSNNERIQDDLNHIPHNKFLTIQDCPCPNDDAQKKGKKRGNRKMPCEKRRLGEISTGETLYIPRREINWLGII